jgi:protein-S-isoprenylcysteine O-methyltransferase Ste14
MAVNTAASEAGQTVGLRVLLRPQVLDRLEQVGILLFWGPFAWRMLNSTNPYAARVMISEFAVLLFTLIRRPTTAISVNLGDWMLACTATFAPLLVIPADDSFPALANVGLFLLIVGNFWQAVAKFVLRRSFGIAPANRGVKVGGPYRYMRHPMYAGYLLVHIGVTILMFSWHNLLIYLIGWTAQIRRLLAEERLLSDDPDYARYMGVVRWRLLPGIF